LIRILPGGRQQPVNDLGCRWASDALGGTTPVVERKLAHERYRRDLPAPAEIHTHDRQVPSGKSPAIVPVEPPQNLSEGVDRSLAILLFLLRSAVVPAVDVHGHCGSRLASILLREQRQRSVELRGSPELSLIVELDEGQTVVGVLLDTLRSMHPVGRTGQH